MREILFKNITSKKNNRRVILVDEKSGDKKYNTHTRKIFAYIIRKSKFKTALIKPPVFNITKWYDTKTKEEKFTFRVKGMLYIMRDEQFYKIDFSHSIRLELTKKAPKSK